MREEQTWTPVWGRSAGGRRASLARRAATVLGRPPPRRPAASPPTFILWISAFMALISVWPVSESTEARISFASWIFFSQSMIWCL